MFKPGICIVGELELDKPDYYINKKNERVDYRDVSVKVAPMKFITVRVPSDYKILKDKDSNLIVLDGVNSNARKWDNDKKQFDYINISYFITKQAN